MCILCVASRFSRRIITVLPWFFIPLIILWAFSQLLPPSLRFEITSPRLACIFVLLISIGWYEFILPRLSAWRAHRSAQMKEKKRVKEQLEAKWLREAVRKCRNCSTAYRDQNPVNGRFMCCYCGHISRRPVLNVTGPDPSKTGLESMEIYLRSCVGTYGGTYQGGKCPSRESYAGGVICIVKKLKFPFFFVLWLWKKIWRRSSSSERSTSNSLCRTDLQKSEDRCNVRVNKVEKAKRKAEEKRQARLAKEMLEEEERKQREEVARLVEERRKLRIERLEVDKASETEAAKQREETQREKEVDRERQAMEKAKAKIFCKNGHSADGGDLKNKNSNKHEQKRKLEKCRETEKVPEYTAKHVREPVNFVKNSEAPHLTWGKGSRSNGQAKRGVINGTAKIGTSQYSGSMKYSIVSSGNSPSYSSAVAWACGKQLGMKSGKTDKPLYASSNGNGFSGSMGLNCGQSTYSVWNRAAWSNLWNKGTHIVHEGSCNKEKLLCNSKGQEDYEAMKHLYSCMERVYPPESPVGVELQTTSRVTTHIKPRHLTSSGISYSSVLGIKLEEENPVEAAQVISSSSPSSIISFSSPKPTQLGLEPATPRYSKLVSVSGSAAQILSPSDFIPQHFCTSPVRPVTAGNASCEDSLYEKDAVSLLRPLSDSLGNLSSEIGSTFPVDTRATGILSSECTPIPALSHRNVHNPSPVSRASSMEANGSFHVNGEQLSQITDLWNWQSLFSGGSEEISENQNKQIWNKPKDSKCEFGKHSWSLPAQNMSDQERIKPFSPELLESLAEVENHVPACILPSLENGHPRHENGDANNWLSHPAPKFTVQGLGEVDSGPFLPSFANGIKEELIQNSLNQ